MQIPEYFKEKMIRALGERGETWINNLPDIIDSCTKKWNLTISTVSSDLSYNFVCFASSLKYGDVALKIGIPHPELYSEIKALSLFEGRNICKCYDSDKELGAMLLERVTPGDNLTSLNDNKKQLNIAADLISKLPIPIDDDPDFPTYKDWINRAFNRARREGKVGTKLLFLIDEAEKLFDEVNLSNYPKSLLHGDLHHWNILKDSDSWKIIDPKGVIGLPFMDSARFIGNQIDMVEDENKFKHLDEMITVFSEKFNESKKVIAICYFVLNVLSICWTFEEVDPKKEDLTHGIAKSAFSYNYLQTL